MSARCAAASLVAQTVKKKICLQRRRPGFHPWVRKVAWRREWLPAQYSCLENSMDKTNTQGVQSRAWPVGGAPWKLLLPPLLSPP